MEMKKFRLLNADEIECRVSQINERGLSLLLYKTARTDANLLDETYGSERWQNDFKLVDGVLYGGIGIVFPEMNGEWVWKWDAGTESNTEAEKGRASDAFKRAGFKWGIGRELYSAPFIWISADKCTIKEGRNGKLACNDNFIVSKISYDAQSNIRQLEIRAKNVVVYSMGTAEASQQKPEPKAELKCEKCGEVIQPFVSAKGTEFSPEKIAASTKKKYGRVLCAACAANES